LRGRLRLSSGLNLRLGLGRRGFRAFAHFVLAALAGGASGATDAEARAGVMKERATGQASRTGRDHKYSADALSHIPLTHSLNFAEIDEDAVYSMA